MLHNVGLASQQYQVIRDRLLAEDPELDERTLGDTVEGLTDLHEIIAAIVRGALEDEALASGLKERIGVMQGRMDRLAERAGKRRKIARDVMLDCAIQKVVAPDLTVSTRSGSPALVVTDEGIIPADFWESRDPRLNRQSLLCALKQGATIAGAALSNPEPVLSVRTK